MREKRTLLKENSNHDNDNDNNNNKVDIKVNVQSIAKRNGRFKVRMSLEGFCHKDYFLIRQLLSRVIAHLKFS